MAFTLKTRLTASIAIVVLIVGLWVINRFIRLMSAGIVRRTIDMSSQKDQRSMYARSSSAR